MTVRHLVRVDQDTLERLAFNTGAPIEIDTANDRAYIRIDNTTFTTRLPQEVCS